MLDWIVSKMLDLGFDLDSLMKKSIPEPRIIIPGSRIIFVDNDALAFFDSTDSLEEPIDVAEIGHN